MERLGRCAGGSALSRAPVPNRLREAAGALVRPTNSASPAPTRGRFFPAVTGAVVTEGGGGRGAGIVSTRVGGAQDACRGVALRCAAGVTGAAGGRAATRGIIGRTARTTTGAGMGAGRAPVRPGNATGGGAGKGGGTLARGGAAGTGRPRTVKAGSTLPPVCGPAAAEAAAGTARGGAPGRGRVLLR